MTQPPREPGPLCTCGATERLGLAWKPKKSFTICVRCWRRRGKNLARGHGYSFYFPKAE